MADTKSKSQQAAESKRSVVIINYKNDRIELDPSTVIDFTVHESLEDNVIHGDITILDIGGFEERIPIIGQERISLSFGTKSLDNISPQNKNFVIYNMSPKLIDEGKKQAYVLFFVSEEYIANLRYKVSRSYRKFGYEIVSDVYNEFIKSNVTYPKTIFGVDNKNVDSTLYPMHFVMGMFRPFECINMVAKKSVSGRGNKIGSNFLFYENKDGFHFRSIESLLEPKSSINDLEQLEDSTTLEKFRQSQELQFTTDPIVDRYVLMPANALSEGDIFDLSSEENIISAYKFESTFNVIANLVGGMYNSRLLTYDPVTMRIGALDNEGATSSSSKTDLSTRKSNVRQKFYDYDYLQRFNQFTHNFGSANPLITKKHFAYGSPESSYKYVSTNFERDGRKQTKLLSKIMGGETNYEINTERWLLPNMSRKRQMKNIVLSVRVPGNHTRTIGDLVYIDLPSSHFSGEKHRYYAGNYLITHLSHKIVGDSYFMDMKLVKDNLSEKLKYFEDVYGVTRQELLDAGAENSFLDALASDNNVYDDEIGDE